MVFDLGMRGMTIKQLSTIHFQLSIALGGLKKLYFFNCISLRINVIDAENLFLIGKLPKFLS